MVVYNFGHLEGLLDTTHCTPHVYTACCTFITSDCKHKKIAWAALKIYMAKWTSMYEGLILKCLKSLDKNMFVFNSQERKKESKNVNLSTSWKLVFIDKIYQF